MGQSKGIQTWKMSSVTTDSFPMQDGMGRSVARRPLKWNGSGGKVSPPSVRAEHSSYQTLRTESGRHASRTGGIRVVGSAVAPCACQNKVNFSILRKFRKYKNK